MNKRKIIFITGGARSGKSSFALSEASHIPGNRVFLATAEALDEEMRDRIEKHRRQRGKGWETCEEPLEIAALITAIADKYKAIVIDCLTLWLSNVLIKAQDMELNAEDTKIDASEVEIEKLLVSLREFQDFPTHGPERGGCSLFLVSNEVGMGIVPENELARKFRDMAGLLNRQVAETADEVYMVVAGIPVRIK